MARPVGGFKPRAGSGRKTGRANESGPFQVRGDKFINDALKSLAFKDGKAALRSVMRKAMRPIYDRAIELTPIGMTSRAISSIKIFSTEKRDKGRLSIQVSSSKSRFQGAAFYFSFFELGTKRQRAQRPLRRAYVELQDVAMGIVRANIGKAVERKVKALARKAAKGFS